ncbi:hypothetical protein CC117_12505 [Parafrankia colletiae]|uniref:Uncharacterized protein n=1 Tax=Parafrankia colletiae TaxID=573497 RepID=A0A1S1RAT1_9ACTN|nr:hypothetical protein [Parafrankia colletiae]MCK9900133.1 hypothetical protein [Frankia sp. Cpl3]OHV42372.1 hypothetical protein CC117_12505 [Parafrankia colletiae]
MRTSPPKRTPTSAPARALHRGAAAVLIAAVPVAVAGLLGQDYEQDSHQSELSYVVRPPDILAGWMTTIGIVALLLATAAASLLLHRGRSGDADRRQWQVLWPLVGVGVILGLGYHIATAGVIGANIGFGFVLLFGVPLAIVLLLVAVARAWALRAEDRGHASRPS